MPSRWHPYDGSYCYNNYHNNWNKNVCMNNKSYYVVGGWRDSILRKDLNNKSSWIILNAITSNDFKQNVAPVLKITNNNAYMTIRNNSNITSNASSITIDKLWILSTSEISMPIINNYAIIDGYNVQPHDANVHYYDSDSYNNTIKSSSDGNTFNSWYPLYNYIYAGNAYQWWMLYQLVHVR